MNNLLVPKVGSTGESHPAVPAARPPSKVTVLVGLEWGPGSVHLQAAYLRPTAQGQFCKSGFLGLVVGRHPQPCPWKSAALWGFLGCLLHAWVFLRKNLVWLVERAWAFRKKPKAEPWPCDSFHLLCDHETAGDPYVKEGFALYWFKIVLVSKWRLLTSPHFREYMRKFASIHKVPWEKGDNTIHKWKRRKQTKDTETKETRHNVTKGDTQAVEKPRAWL